jgi:hypothetical protein
MIAPAVRGARTNQDPCSRTMVVIARPHATLIDTVKLNELNPGRICGTYSST